MPIKHYVSIFSKSITHICSLILICCVGFSSAHALSDATAKPSDPQASPAAKAVQAYLAALTNNIAAGVIAGQNSGHSDDISNTSGLSGYRPLINELEKQTGEAPGIIGVDYEHNQIATPEQLRKVNVYLIDYWNKGGLITINWSPHNPWWNDESNIEKKPGTWSDTRTKSGDMSKVNLKDLVDPKSPVRTIWLRKLDRIATALLELQSAGVVVLWRPMQEMNGNWFWWGVDSTARDANSYIAIWQDMYQYFTQTKGLHNLLWVYSPNQSPNLFERSFIKDPMYYYPGDKFVDIFAGTTYNNELKIKDYEIFKQSGKPIAIAEFGPKAGESISRNGTLDTLLYKKQLQEKYPAIAYWVSWSSWGNEDGTRENQALIHHKNVKSLLTDPAIITRNRISWKNYLTTNTK